MKTNSVSCPALLVTAPASGHGKTSVTAALARFHSRNGLRVRCFKTGPDFIDPTLLAAASGQAVYNLDSWIMGSEHCRQLLYDAAAESDLILVEGVMGLFDGEPSSADLAELFGLPVLPVIDAAAMAQTFAAVLHGLATFRPSLTVAGAVANRVASARHADLLRTGLPAGLQLASLPRNPQASLPGRHLGLQLADEIADIAGRLDQLADAIGETWLAKLPPVIAFAAPARSPKPEPLLQGKTIAVARDRAFCFLYQQNLDCLRDMGARLKFFSPLADDALPDADAVYLPGGYPELYADTLAGNNRPRADIQAHIAQAKPLLAECGGMMYLTEALLDVEGRRHEMLGVMPGVAVMQGKLSAIGSQLAELDGQIVRGHTFHYSTLQTPLSAIAQAQTVNGHGGEAVYRVGSATASYLHFYFPSNPETIAGLFLA
ncbi:cobyrinate a,c-diamide synthase [Methylobacter sp. BBA5.1]|uniref:cobyrinate a,c-diamide synthase n=1 Tax=Methylobacter sp. BBA5.1 TaxID=1495064 RepID=UPI00055ED1D2|nr:cobyrinate a,c-diamide synthase [Methylobacter sp. BBA5.1]